MLRVKSKYKIAKRLGAGVFEQTQTQKFALAEARSKKERRGGRGGSDFGRQLLEKQRIRYTYGLSEKQLSNYAQMAMEQKDPSGELHKALEMRADSVVYRAGLAPTRRAARQAVSHGHITVNGVRITRPSFQLKKGDKLAVREGVRKSPLYAGLAEKEEGRSVPQWVAVDANTLTAEVTGEPQYTPVESGLDYSTLFEFYSR
ncbi:MAG TPA: 30S ribosomal protein S4 [Candidatus Paceibacterota bacterium]|nr:30S ribosomal protein S4 [Candidatus Paceibacterota bacterium]